jgi:hypothetical protein
MLGDVELIETENITTNSQNYLETISKNIKA